MEIKLGGKNGGTTIVSPEDYAIVSKYSWHQSDKGYVCGSTNYRTVRLHRFIMGALRNQKVDHMNRNRLDNRRDNLRVVTIAQNNQNRSISKSKTSSKYRGVSYVKKSKLYRARIVYQGTETLIGYFKTEIEAAEAFDVFILNNQDKFVFVNINFPEKKDEFLKRECKEKPKKKTEYIGVSYSSGKYSAYITHNKKRIYLLFSDDSIKCAKARDKYVIDNNIINKELNFPEDYPDYKPVQFIKTLCEKMDDKTVKLLISDDNTKVPIIDKEDYDKIKYYACYINKDGYVGMTTNTTTTLHRFLMEVTDPDIFIDHKNSIILDNRRENLRLSDVNKNQQNISKRKTASSSKYMGVCYNKLRKKWSGYLAHNNKRVLACYCDTEEAAARKRDLYIKLYLPETHYKLNFTWTNEDIEEWSKKLNMTKDTKKITKTSNYHGVEKSSKNWKVRVSYKNKIVYSAVFKKEIDAARYHDLYILQNLKNLKRKLNFEWSEKDIKKWLSKKKHSNEKVHIKIKNDV